MIPTRIQEIRQALSERRDDGRTHWVGCEVERDHRDCAIAWLLTAWDTRDTALRSLVQQWREEKRAATTSGDPDALERATVWEDCAEALARLLTSEDR